MNVIVALKLIIAATNAERPEGREAQVMGVGPHDN